MAAYLLTYDLKTTSPDPHEIVRKALREEGWYSKLTKNGVNWAYPDTTRSGSFADDDAAVEAYRTAIRNAKSEASKKGKGQVVIEKVYITDRTEVLFETDDKTPVSK